LNLLSGASSVVKRQTSMNTRPSSTMVVYVFTGTMHGGLTTSPVLMLNAP
jgi:hypothetical protein